jgi:hypothetical protein
LINKSERYAQEPTALGGDALKAPKVGPVENARYWLSSREEKAGKGDGWTMIEAVENVAALSP